jgi:hypothetical protein
MPNRARTSSPARQRGVSPARQRKRLTPDGSAMVADLKRLSSDALDGKA